MRLTLSVSAELRRAGMGKKMMVDAPHANGRKTKPDASLVKLILKAHALNNALVNSGGETLAAVAKREGLTGSYMTRLVRLSFLSPDIVRAILDGRHPLDLTARQAHTPIKASARLESAKSRPWVYLITERPSPD